MGDAAAVPWGSGPVYRPPDARSEWEEPVRRPTTVTPLRRGILRIDAARAEDVLEDVTVARARRALALRRRLNRATAQATRAVEQRQRQATLRVAPSTTGALERLERERLEAMAELEAIRRAAEERLQQRAADAERQAAEEAARQAAEEATRAEAARAALARVAVEQAEHERQTALKRREAEQAEQARLAALEAARAEEEARQAAWAERVVEEAWRASGRQRLALANKLEQSAAFLRDYEEWARARGLRGTAQDAGLSSEADRLGRRVDELRYG